MVFIKEGNMIRQIEGDCPAFILDTDNTTYALKVLPSGQIEHLYYGKKIRVTDTETLREKHAFAPGNTIFYNNDDQSFSLEDMCLETSAIGKGDIREPMVCVENPDGSNTLDFVYIGCEITKGKKEYKTLPGSYDDNNDIDTLKIKLRDKNEGYILELYYHTFEKEDVITRSAKFLNESAHEVKLTRMLSMQLDLNENDFVITTLHGGWAKEMNIKRTRLGGGKFVNDTRIGYSSSRSNPLFVLGKEDTTEEKGRAFGINLIYSGNHYEAAEENSFKKTRIVTGINPETFEWHLAVGEEFEAPEAVLTYSEDGYNGMSGNFHKFVRKHIVRGQWRDKIRPVLLNSWEAAYFDINESSLIKLARAGKDVGIELFVMDDGWFGQRNDDKKALGDWDVNLKKLPNGVKGLCDKVNALGLDFGIWIEPEMVNVDSDLYRAHPDWAIDIPEKHHSEGRNQRILDFSNPEVVDYITEKISAVLRSANIAYVKWDMNRIFSDYYSHYLPKEKMKELNHRYTMGFYRLAKALTEGFPNILFEGCASGGNRFDLGALCFFPQIWGSDNTDAISRLAIHNGYSYGYPMNCVGSHVSGCPNHQTLRITPLETRFNVASFGSLGYELNLCDAKKDELDEIKEEIEIYKKYRETMQHGTFYRRRAGNVYEWTVVSEDKSTAVGMVCRIQTMPGEMYEVYFATGLKEDAKYHFFGREMKYNIKHFGDLINTAAPIHVKQDSVIHNIIAKMIKMDGEKEDYTAYGDSMMYAGVKLKQSFVGTGYSDQVRFFPDYGSRLYFMEEVKE